MASNLRPMSSQQTIFMEEPELKWYAVTTRSRHEKVVAEQLWQKEIECFLPLREVLSTWKDRRKKIQLPLFPGYLFVHVPIVERRLNILKVPSVVRIVGFNGESDSIPEVQLQAVKRLTRRMQSPKFHRWVSAVGSRTLKAYISCLLLHELVNRTGHVPVQFSQKIKNRSKRQKSDLP